MTADRAMVNLETQLAADADGSLKDRLCAELSSQRETLKRAADAGLPPDEFQRTQRVLTGIDSALSVVQTLWKSAHPG